MREEEEPDLNFIGTLSDAANKQTSVDEADRRSNLNIQTRIQSNIFNEYGFFYEKKRGEFYNGLQSAYLTDLHIINRYELLRAYYAFSGNPRWARQKGKEVLFRIDYFNTIMDSASSYRKMFFSWLLLRQLHDIERAKTKGDWEDDKAYEKIDFGLSLKYGKMAVISAIGLQKFEDPDLAQDRIVDLTEKKLLEVLKKWHSFEEYVKKKHGNSDYNTEDGFDFDNYYKGKTVNDDIPEFFNQQSLVKWE